MDGYHKVIRVELPYNALGSGYGIIYTKNNSRYSLKETLTFELFGMEISWPPGAKSGESFEMELEPNEDFIVILRRTEVACQYSLSYMTHPREYDDSELIQKAKEVEKKSGFGEEEAFYKVYSTVAASVIYFENPDTEKTLIANFELELDNLVLDDCNNASFSLKNLASFQVVLKPGASASKILRQIQSNLGTKINMVRYSFKVVTPSTTIYEPKFM